MRLTVATVQAMDQVMEVKILDKVHQRSYKPNQAKFHQAHRVYQVVMRVTIVMARLSFS